MLRTYDLEPCDAEDREIAGSSNITVVEAISATTAAPFIVKPMQIDRDKLDGKVDEDDDTAADGDVDGVSESEPATFLDGGLYMNDPALAAYVEAKRLYGHDKEVLMISIGTGQLSPELLRKQMEGGWLGLSGLACGMMEISECSNRAMLARLLRKGTDYFRYNVPIENEKNDDASLIPYFRKAAASWLDKNENQRAQLQALGRFCARYSDDILAEAVTIS